MNGRITFSRCMMAMGLVLFIWGAHGSYIGWKAASWPHVTGVVIESFVKKSYMVRYPHVLYGYRVNGVLLKNDRLMSGPKCGPGTKNPDALVDRLKVQKQIRVYYHPLTPEKSLLVTGIGDAVLLLLLCGATFFSAGLLLTFPEGNGWLGFLVFILFILIVVFVMVPKVRNELATHDILSTMDRVVIYDSQPKSRQKSSLPQTPKRYPPPTSEVVHPPSSPEKHVVAGEKRAVLYVASAKGVFRVDETGRYEIVVADIKNSYSLDVYEDRLYVSAGTRGATIKYFTLEGRLLNAIPIPAAATEYLTFKCLPRSRFALMDNTNDTIFFIDDAGRLLNTAKLSHPDKHWQDLDGITVNHSFYVGEVGESTILTVNLDTFEVSMFKDLSDRLYAISSIAYSSQSGLFYAGDQDRGLYAFSQMGSPERISNPKAGYMYYADIEIDYPLAYIMGTKGAIVIMDLKTGFFEKHCDLGTRTRALAMHVR